jgi:hypothetical protein
VIFREVEDRDLIAKARRGDVEGYTSSCPDGRKSS